MKKYIIISFKIIIIYICYDCIEYLKNVWLYLKNVYAILGNTQSPYKWNTFFLKMNNIFSKKKSSVIIYSICLSIDWHKKITFFSLRIKFINKL